MAFRPSERPPNHHPPPPPYPASFAQPQTGQPPMQIPFSDPFQTSRDPFLPGAHMRRGSFGPARGWPPATGNNMPQQHHQPPHASPQQVQPVPAPLPNGLGQMPFSYNPLRRRSLGGAGSPPQYTRGPGEVPPPPPSFPTRNMPPPSPPQMPPPAASTHLASAPRGPPTASPFPGVRDLASLASYRPGAGMSISSILGGGEDRKPNSSPHISAVAPSPTPMSMQPPSPGRARSSSMREPLGRREPSPMRGGMFGEPRAQSAFHDRNGSEPRRDGIFASPQFPRESPHSFRAFRPDQQEQRGPFNGAGPMGRPNSQPTEQAGSHNVEEMIGRREMPGEGRFGTFRHFGEPAAPPPRSDVTPRHDAHPFTNGVTSQPREHDMFGSPQMDRDVRHAPMRFQYAVMGTPMREDQAGLFRPSFQHAPDAARESIEARTLHDMRREEPRSSPTMSSIPFYQRGQNGFADRPMTFEEHQRMEAIQREQQQHRKESDGSAPRSLLGISPELNRKGRNSPLPQAVQGAQPRHVGPGGDNPGIKMEFGRMFSGLGSGVGSATPTAGQSVNGVTTPSRLSPVRHLEDGDLVRTAVDTLEDSKAGLKTRGSKKNGRRLREDEEKIDGEGRATPGLYSGNKRTKTVHPGHHHHHHLHSHHHHHHHIEPEAQQGSFNMLRFPSNSGLTNAAAATHPTHHHHHHHATHAHPAHHHHQHAPRSGPPPKKPAVSVTSTRLLEEVAGKQRNHLGSQLYTTELSQSANADTPSDAKIKFASKMKPIPVFERKENCTYTVRVPRYYFTSTEANLRGEPSALEEICKRGQLWGTEVYTDDSDVVAAAVHSGWLKGDFGDQNEDLNDLCDNESEAEVPADDTAEAPLTLTSRPNRPAKPPADHPDVHITLLVLPPLDGYASTTQHHVRSKEWKKTHDGVSFIIHRVDFVDEGVASRFVERGLAARKQRIAVEEAKRREAAAGLLMFAHGGVGGSAVSVGA